MENTTEIEEITLQNQIAEELRLRENTRSNASDFIIYNLLEDLSKQLQRLEKELSVEKYKIAFIGSIGSGKTTTICHLLKLLIDKQSEVQVQKRKITKKQTIPILSTGAGATTLCEVEIKYADKVFIQLDPFKLDDVKTTLRNFAEIIISRYSGKPETDPDSNGGIEPMPVELERVLRSFTGLQKMKSTKRGDEKEEPSEDASTEYTRDTDKKDGTEMDRAIELYIDFKKNGKSDEDYVEEVVNRANLDKRNETVFEINEPIEMFEGESLRIITDWLFKTFEKINLGKMENMVLPKRIILNIPFVEELKTFESFVDTKGLDSGMPRPNIENHLTEIDTICVFTSKFAPAPEPNILEFLKRNIRFNHEHHFEKHLILVLPWKDEPEKTMTQDGAADDWQTGVNYKKDTVINRFKDAGIKIPEDQIHFYNPLNWFSDGIPNNDFRDIINDEREEVFSQISDIIEHKRHKITQRIDKIHNDFLQLKGGNLSDEDQFKLSELRSILLTHQDLNFNAPSMILEMVEIYKSSADTKNARTKHCINSNDWIHPYRDIDVVNLLKEIYIIPAILENSKRKVSIIKKCLQEMQDKEGSQLFKQVGKQLADIFEKEYQKFISDAANKTEALIWENVDEPFFQSLYKEWGRGPGYNVRVADLFASQLARRNVRDRFEEIVNEEWKNLIANYSTKLR